jgi:hypothetical protein
MRCLVNASHNRDTNYLLAIASAKVIDACLLSRLVAAN